MSKTKKHSRRYKFFAWLFSFGFLTLGVFLFWASRLQLPDVSAFNTRVLSETTHFYDKTGTVELFNLNGEVRRTEIPFESISNHVKQATISIEDAEFYQHHGIKPTAILRSVFVDITTLNFSQGGSTITQQVIKNSLLTSNKSITRKLKEWVLSLKLERVLSKDQILSIYLNEAPYGGNIYGVEEASEVYFGVTANELTLAQSAYLAALPQAPTYYSPYGNHKDALEKRKNTVLDRMLSLKMISQAEYDEAKKENVVFKPFVKTSTLAPHFVFYLRDYLANKYGQEALDQGGLKVTTSIDANLQQKAEEIVKKYATSNKEKFDAENAGLVAIDPKTGQILAMVGSRDYFDRTIDGNFNITLANRQPGSSIKPFVYATAFEKGYTPETVLFDVPTEFSTTCSDDSKPLSASAVCYNPQNYDEKFRGPINLRNSLAQSLNVPSVKVLYLAGINDSLRVAESMGITTLTDPARYGLTMVLGGGEVSLLEMTSAYSVFANDGVRNPYTGILKVEDNDGNTLEEYKQNDYEVIPNDVARTISSILSDNVARTPSYGPNSALYFPNRQVAVKTGTTNDYRDAWTIGYTPSIAVGTWAGNNDNHPMHKKVAGQVVAPMWNEYMNYALSTLPNDRFKDPTPTDESTLPAPLRGIRQGGDVTYINNPNGDVSARVTQNIHSILYWIDKNNPKERRGTNPSADPQFSHWEYAVRKWASENGYTDGGTAVVSLDQNTIPTGLVNNIVDNATPNPGINISKGDDDYSNHPFSKAISFNVSGNSAFDLSSVDVYLNSKKIGVVNDNPFYFSIQPREVQTMIKKDNTLKIIGYSKSGGTEELSLPLVINMNK